ncbi:Glycosyl transferase family 2 [Roseivivax halotolerans]|uniref:Glycosyl transferase family 2 n=1 Tax=Roseivivax halotolerans TaxID=93684 RepID=A0A1I5UUV6_9RHOB|nr:glycosyltransferase family 2 protein [Roseivivax halotolerans]SFP99051.1 Glycosyl transferase family 2 [Roseivivax halotolerans]
MRWGVVSTVAEPPELLAAHAAHYVTMGASEIRYYLDRSDPRINELLGRVPQVHLIGADEAFYTDIVGVRRKPAALNRKQRFNAEHAVRTMEVDWLLHVDADEFLAAEEFAGLLSALPDDIDSLHIPNGERVWLRDAPVDTIFDGALLWQVPGPPRAARRLLGDELALFTDRGFCGHALGKSVTRTGRGLSLGLHGPRREPPARIAESREAKICHFDGLTRAHWCAKLMRYAAQGMYKDGSRAQSFRARQIAEVTEAGGDGAAALALHDKLRVLGPELADALRQAGCLEPMPCDPARATAALFGGSVDLRPEAFDRSVGLSSPD